MVATIHVETILGPLAPYGADITDLSIDFSSGMTLTAFAGSNASARLVNFDISGVASFTSETYLGAATDGFQTVDFGANTVHLSNMLLSGVLNVSPGQSQDGTDLTSLNNGQASAQTAAIGVDMGANSFLVASQPNSAGLSAFQVQGDGSLIAITPAPDPAVGQISDLNTISAYGNTWILGTSLATDTVESYTIDGTGNLSHTASFGAPDGLGIATPTDIVPFMLEGQPHIVLAGGDTGSLSVLRLEADGSFTATDHILDDLNTRFDGPTVLETTTVGDTTFILAAGSDDGFSLFRVLPDGMLHHLTSVSDTASATLNNVSAATLGNDAGNLRMFFASGTEAGLSHFTYDISNFGNNIIGSSANDTLTGTTLGEVIMGAAGDDTIDGGAGDDILIDGAGNDTLTGGAGADVYTMVADGDDDTIQGFERGIDALDLSRYPLLYDPNALGYVATAYGARLTFQGEILDIHSSDFNTLTLGELIQNAPFNVDRPALVLGGGSTGNGQTQIGDGADDTLIGGQLDDLLSGNGGDDTLMGGSGADTLMGGLGFDTVSYATATNGITLDLNNMASNTNDAAGDQFTSIEAIDGSGFADHISGDDAVQNFMGMNGNDTLNGRGGNDILNGGYGNDILNGGTGADTLIGGAQTDQASYFDAAQELRIDLEYTHRNTGDAAGDSYSSIEDISGSAQNDAIYGDALANSIWGLAGDDWLIGRAGDDSLFGGAGDDVLVGGAGADVLDGGTGTDRVQYFTAKSGVTVDLANSNANTGIAAGDSYTSIEDVAGSDHNDIITGNDSANRLIGNGGIDRLNGGAGDDQLFGNAGADTFVFQSGGDHDRIGDFDAADLIELDIALLGATAQTGAALIANFGVLSGTTAQFDFGSGDILSIDNITDINDLAASFTFA